MSSIKLDKFKRAVGKRLKNYRKSLELNVVNLAHKIKISQGTLSELENGITAPSAHTLANLSLYTDIDIIWLLTGKGKKNKGVQK